MTFHDEQWARFRQKVLAADQGQPPAEINAFEVEHTPIRPGDVVIITVKTSDDKGELYTPMQLHELRQIALKSLAPTLERVTGAKCIVKTAHFALNILSPDASED